MKSIFFFVTCLLTCTFAAYERKLKSIKHLYILQLLTVYTKSKLFLKKTYKNITFKTIFYC